MEYKIKINEFIEATEEFGGRFIIAYYDDGEVDFLHPEASPDALYTEKVDDEELLELDKDGLYNFLSGNFETVNDDRDFKVTVTQ